jgi:hypothetical protein
MFVEMLTNGALDIFGMTFLIRVLGMIILMQHFIDIHVIEFWMVEFGVEGEIGINPVIL